jgi:WD40 repeat protein
LHVRSPGALLVASAIDEDGNTVVSTYTDHTVRVWDVGLAALPENPTHDNPISLIELVGGGSRLVLTVDRGNQVRAWDLDTGDEVEESDEIRKHMEPFWSDDEREPDHLEAMLAALPAPRTDRLISAHGDEWLWALAPNRTRAVRYLRNRVKASETPDPPDAADKKHWIPAQVWDLSAGEPTRRHPNRGRDYRLLGFALTPDGRQAISYGYGSLRQWDLATGRQMRRLEGHDGPIWCVAISIDGTWLVSGSEDSTLRLWSIATGKNVATFTGESPIRACAIEYDASRLMVFGGEDSGRVHLLEAVLS